DRSVSSDSLISACLHRSSYIANFPFAFTHTYPFVLSATTTPYGDFPQLSAVLFQALGGFILILNENGEIYYASENIETYLGFHQSDILHQPLFDMIHSEDREDIKQQLAWNYNIPPHVTCLQDLLTPGGMHYLERNVNARFRCLLDNTCGFLRIDIRGKLMSLHGLPQSYVIGRSDTNSSGNTVLGLVAICSPFVPPNVIDQPSEDPILKTKHSLDFTLISMDNRVRSMLELDDKHLPMSFYSLVHVGDALCLAEAHKEVVKNSASGLLIYRLISVRSKRIYWIQSSCRMFYKNGKPESIGLTHRLLTEVEGTMLLEKRASLKAKLLSFDDSLLQSPRNLQSTAALKSSNFFSDPSQTAPPVLMRPSALPTARNTAVATRATTSSNRGRKKKQRHAAAVAADQHPSQHHQPSTPATVHRTTLPFSAQQLPFGILTHEQQAVSFI
ncbi:unnamed protein product, partial [Anisakis simplex]|uniref:Aryl hydrocarbon receptor protein 1 (inferred by orthology to a C. elegans protein) n=1 Tax=Anisakis simplex TaxID=6269 RepID=A0A0M3IZA3_ANISI